MSKLAGLLAASSGVNRSVSAPHRIWWQGAEGWYSAISSIMSIESAVIRSAWRRDQATTRRMRRLSRGVTRMSLPQAVSTLGKARPHAAAHRPYDVT